MLITVKRILTGKWSYMNSFATVLMSVVRYMYLHSPMESVELAEKHFPSLKMACSILFYSVSAQFLWESFLSTWILHVPNIKYVTTASFWAFLFPDFTQYC